MSPGNEWIALLLDIEKQAVTKTVIDSTADSHRLKQIASEDESLVRIKRGSVVVAKPILTVKQKINRMI